MENYSTIILPRISAVAPEGFTPALSDDIFDQIWQNERNLDYTEKNNGTPIISSDVYGMTAELDVIPEELVKGRIIGIPNENVTILLKDEYMDTILSKKQGESIVMFVQFNVFSRTDENKKVLYTENAYFPSAVVSYYQKENNYNDECIF